MHTKIGWHWRPRHIDLHDWELWDRLQMPHVKILNPDPQFVKELFQRNPVLQLCVLRDHPQSEQYGDVAQDPEGTGNRHADEWRDRLHQWSLTGYLDRLAVEGINEPPVWEPGWVELTARYYYAFATRLRQHGIRGMLLNFSVGWPANTGPDTPPNWAPYHAVLEAMEPTLGTNRSHILGLHEYWPEAGPDDRWPWLAGRYTMCPWDVPIYLGEVGLHPPGQLGGWARYVNADEYLAQLERYDNYLCSDARILGAAVFLYDYDTNEWAHHDIRQIRDTWAERFGGRECQPVEPPPGPDPKPPEEPLARGTVTANTLNVRRGPGIQNDVVDQLHLGDRVAVWGQDADEDGDAWYRIHDTEQRWVHSNFVVLDEELPEAEPIPVPGTDFVWPIAGKSWVTQYWGENPDWYQGKGHMGLDIGAEQGTPLVAMADGEVRWVDEDPSGYGYYVRILHPDLGYRNGVVQSFYGHMAGPALVQRGDYVRKGQVVGYVGSTGNSTGPHLHLEIRRSTRRGAYLPGDGPWGRGRVDPVRFMWDLSILPVVTESV